jgi:hypothetical protein
MYPSWSTQGTFDISTIDEVKNIEYKFLIKNKDVSFIILSTIPFFVKQSFNLKLFFNFK